MKQNLLPVSIILSILFSTLAGCYDYTRIKPREVVKLNNTYSIKTGYRIVNGTRGTTRRPIISKSVRHIYKADGTVTELVGQADIVITTNKRRYTFKHPIIASIDKKDILTIASKNYPQTKIPMKNIKKVVLKQYNLQKTMVAILVVQIPIIALAVLIGLAL